MIGVESLSLQQGRGSGDVGSCRWSRTECNPHMMAAANVITKDWTLIDTRTVYVPKQDSCWPSSKTVFSLILIAFLYWLNPIPKSLKSFYWGPSVFFLNWEYDQLVEFLYYWPNKLLTSGFEPMKIEAAVRCTSQWAISYQFESLPSDSSQLLFILLYLNKCAFTNI